MTRNGNFKKRVRARAAKTGEAYCAALHHLRSETPPTRKRIVRLAVAQTPYACDPRNRQEIGATGQAIRAAMRAASAAGARILHLPEGAICFPNKRIMSREGPKIIAEADWTRADWDALTRELAAIQHLAGELRLWTMIGSAHRLSAPRRPHSSLYVISDRGELATRYDERLLSDTKISFMYTPGFAPVTFMVDDVSFGCALGMELHYPEIFLEYERLNVDCVLFSTTGHAPDFETPLAAEALGHAACNGFWVSLSAHAPQSLACPAGIAGPNGRWAAQCSADGLPSLGIADIAPNETHPARPWRRKARSGLYDLHQEPADPRSETRDRF
ncbi:carbon-nitrogen hydrolase family protein [Oryzifoliimicrobium ureilyticus]|uniref:carbon-nitrogen hydrolase family protein n=1 Tax=Oryzifoliimicrobium ureilyticus TaxID=3113724 RepID=UPI00307683C2